MKNGKTRLEPSNINLRWYFTLIVLAEIGAAVLLAVTVSSLAFRWLYSNETFWFLFVVVILSVVIGFTFSVIFSRFFSEPITKLSSCMRRVAGGDFSVRLETKSSVREIREVTQGFNLMAEELGTNEMLQEDFVSNVSHEFKTPINAIEGYATLLQDPGLTPDEQSGCVEKIMFNTRRLSELVGNILLLSKVDNQAIHTNITAYRLDEQIRQALVMTERDWSMKGIDPDVELSKVEITANESLMMRVWLNLIGNAIKFDPSGGILKIRLSTGEGRTVFTVEDSGPGIAPEAMHHIFDRFYQADSSHKAEGNGLGLALSKRIIDASGGRIEVENRPEGGALFRVLL